MTRTSGLRQSPLEIVKISIYMLKKKSVRLHFEIMPILKYSGTAMKHVTHSGSPPNRE